MKTSKLTEVSAMVAEAHKALTRHLVGRDGSEDASGAVAALDRLMAMLAEPEPNWGEIPLISRRIEMMVMRYTMSLRGVDAPEPVIEDLVAINRTVTAATTRMMAP